MDNISILLAFSAGLLSFLSPCVLPLIPAYVGYLTGASIDELSDDRKNIFILYKSLGFVLGFSFVFITMGATATSIGKFVITHQVIFRKISGLLIIIFGIHTLGILKIKLLYYEKKVLSYDKINGKLAPIIMGIAFAAGWTPCIGPILSTILLYAANINTVSTGMLLLVMYSLGLAVPFIFTALAIERFSLLLRKFSKFLPIVSILSGMLMIFIGTMIFLNKITELSRYFNFFNF